MKPLKQRSDIIISKIIELSTTCDSDYFEDRLKHGYLDIAEVDDAQNTTWSIRVGIVEENGNCARFIDVYTARESESIGADQAELSLNFKGEDTFLSAWQRQKKIIAETYRGYGDIVKTDEKIIEEYLEQWERLFLF